MVMWMDERRDFVCFAATGVGLDRSGCQKDPWHACYRGMRRQCAAPWLVYMNSFGAYHLRAVRFFGVCADMAGGGEGKVQELVRLFPSLVCISIRPIYLYTHIYMSQLCWMEVGPEQLSSCGTLGLIRLPQSCVAV